MISIYLTDDGKLRELEQIVPGAWVHLCAPTEEEVATVCAKLCVEPDLVRAALDEEERSRIDFEDGHMLVLVDTPTVEAQQGRGFVYSTLPFGIILTEENIITVCLKESALARAFSESPVKNFSTKKKNRMTLQLLYRNATLFLFYLREVDKAIEDEAISARLKRMTDAGGKIYDILEKEPARAGEVRRFMNYYLPTADKLLTQYRELDGSGSQGENVRGAMTVVENSLEMIAVAFERQLDSLYRHEAMDIQTDIDVLETMLAADGIRPESKPEDTAPEKKEEEQAHV